VKSPQTDEIKDFLLSRKQHASRNRIGSHRRKEWIDAVNQLYKKITDELLAESKAQKLVTVSRVDKEIEEDYLGKYKVPELILDINGEKVRFSPKGSDIAGAKGRVDLIGDLDSMTLILDRVERTWTWSVVLSRVPRQVAALDGKTLAEALRRVMR
jgi:hypothetical protein